MKITFKDGIRNRVLFGISILAILLFASNVLITNLFSLEVGKVMKKCPNCDGNLIVRKSFYGEFLGCSNYPKCRTTERINKPKK